MISTDDVRTICTALRKLYEIILKNKTNNFKDMEELITYAYISAKKMNKKLCEHAGKIDKHDTESVWLDQLKNLREECL